MNAVRIKSLCGRLSALGWCAFFALAAPLSGQILLHDYTFQNTLNDSVGNVALQNNGATLGSSSLVFGTNQGPTLSVGSTLSGNYSIGMTFSLNTISGYDKIVDFGLLGPDSGFYNYYGNLNMYPSPGSGASSFAAGQIVNVVITRDSSTNLFTAYLNGVMQFSFTDGSSTGVASVSNGQAVFNFFQDDSATGHNEASAGTLYELKVWDSALAAVDVPNALSGIPEPASSATLAGLGFLAAACYQRRRRSKKVS